MRNPLTIVIETVTGSIFVLIFSGLMLYLFYLAVNDFKNEAEILTSSRSWLNVISSFEKGRINNWVEINKIIVPAGKNKYQYLNENYPDKPWLTE